MDAEYLVTDDVRVDGELSIGPGARLVFQQDTGMSVPGSLSAVGTEADPIVFTAEQAIAGYWDGLEYSYSDSPDNALDYVTIEYGGGERPREPGPRRRLVRVHTVQHHQLHLPTQRPMGHLDGRIRGREPRRGHREHV